MPRKFHLIVELQFAGRHNGQFPGSFVRSKFPNPKSRESALVYPQAGIFCLMAESTLTELKNLLATPEPPELGPGPRPGILAESAINEKLDQLFDRGEIASAKQPLIRALVLLWHDHLARSHVISQSIDGSDGSFVHGIMHRREPDYSNAKYWFNRVGAHPSYPEIAAQVGALTAKKDSPLIPTLTPEGRWDAFAFVDACEAANRPRSTAPSNGLLREIQKIESEVLLSRFAAGVK